MRVEHIGDATLILGDCLSVLPTLGKVDAVVTDPPYDRKDYEWEYVPIERLGLGTLHGLWFWQANTPFPLNQSAHHIWSKCNVCIGDAEPYESVFEVNGRTTSLVFRHSVINCDMNAQMNGDEYFSHPTQKPIKLMSRLVKRTSGTVLDPFMGSGTTGVACAKLGRKFIGIEIDETYFDIACKRIEEAYNQPDLFIEPPAKAEQMELTG